MIDPAMKIRFDLVRLLVAKATQDPELMQHLLAAVAASAFEENPQPMQELLRAEQATAAAELEALTQLQLPGA